MSRQHATPLLIPADGGAATPLVPLAMGAGGHQVSEAEIQALVQAHPACLPITEIDPLFAAPVPICIELNTPAGPIDNFMVTASGLPVLVECKLWRNPEGRREVVGQILDYAKELSRWSSSDLQREVSKNLKRPGNALLELVREAGHDVDEIAFNDALTLNLRRGRFLLLIVGDGIREGVEAIAEYLQAHAGLHFTLGLVELPIYLAPDGQRLIAPRVLARTALITREVVSVPHGMRLRDDNHEEVESAQAISPDEEARVSFMRELLAGLTLDDPEQRIPALSPKGWVAFYLPAPAASCYISILFKRAQRQVGLRLTSDTGTIGEAAIARVVAEDWSKIEGELGGTPVLDQMSNTRVRVHEFFTFDGEGTGREDAIRWLRVRVNDYVTVFRPRIRDAVATLTES